MFKRKVFKSIDNDIDAIYEQLLGLRLRIVELERKKEPNHDRRKSARTAKSRKKQSEAMKRYWAKRNAS